MSEPEKFNPEKTDMMAYLKNKSQPYRDTIYGEEFFLEMYRCKLSD